MIVHLVTDADRKRTLCGARDEKGPAVPYMNARYWPRPHLELCEDCRLFTVGPIQPELAP